MSENLISFAVSLGCFNNGCNQLGTKGIDNNVTLDNNKDSNNMGSFNNLKHFPGSL